MPIKVIKNLPAITKLAQENIFVMDTERAENQQIRPLNILLINLMPTKEVTETQIRGGLKDLTAEEAKKVIVAYEPVWAIGTGKTATPEMAQETHRQVRDVLVSMFGNETAEEMIIQYGGSMKPDNAVELLAQKDIDGGLIGGASLKASSFAEIVVAGK